MAATAARDRLFLVGVGVLACVAVSTVRRMLIHYRDAALVPPPEKQSCFVTQDAEDALNLSTLEKLLDSPNYSIQDITSVIVCERAVYDDGVIDALLYHITRPDHDTREDAMRALGMILNSSYAFARVDKPKTWSALVQSLEYSVTDYKHHEFDPEWDSWHFRDAAERDCLFIISQMVDKFGAESLVRYQFVERWLAKEPWSKDPEVKQRDFMRSLTHDKTRLGQICWKIVNHERGRLQLQKAGLLPQNETVVVASPTMSGWQVSNSGRGREESPEEEILRRRSSGWTMTQRAEQVLDEDEALNNRRRREQSTEEDHLRRRHREAMVLNDGSRPFGRGDIFEREEHEVE